MPEASHLGVDRSSLTHSEVCRLCNKQPPLQGFCACRSEPGDRLRRRPCSMRSIEEVRLVQVLIEQGLNDCEISRRTGRSAPHESSAGDTVNSGTLRQRRCGGEAAARVRSPSHDFGNLAIEDGYLLGIYFGDGHLAQVLEDIPPADPMDQRLSRLSSLSASRRWTGHAGRSKVGIVRVGMSQTAEIYSYSKAWPCLLSQHGPGMEHLTKPSNSTLAGSGERDPIRIQGRLLRGLIHSDG